MTPTIRRGRGPLAVAAAAIAVVVISTAPALAATINLDASSQAHLGVVTAPLAPASHADEIDAFAKVLDPGPLAQSVSDLATAEAASAASKAEAARSKALNASGGGVSAKDAEAAVSQARQDLLKVAILRQQIGLQWGPGIASMPPPRLDRLVAALSKGSSALVHVDTHNNDGQAGAKFVRIDIGDGSVRGRVLGPARVAEARLQSSGLIVEVDGPWAVLLSVGLTQSAHIESPTPHSGVVLPRSAVVRFLGSPWAYVQTGPTAFTRRLVLNPVPQEDGFFVAGGFARGERIVVQGADALFAAEQSGPMADR